MKEQFKKTAGACKACHEKYKAEYEAPLWFA